MLRSENQLKGYNIQARDGAIGKVDALFFDERTWSVRYLVVDVGNWLTGRSVLLTPEAVTRIDPQAETVSVDLTKEQVEESPDVRSEPTISRARELALHEHYDWKPYWRTGFAGPATYGAFPPQMAARLFGPLNEPSRDADMPTAADVANSTRLRSTAEVIDYTIEASDGRIGYVTDFLLDDSQWRIRYMVVNTGTWLSGRDVLIALPWIRSISWKERSVRVALTRDAVRHSPEYDSSLLNSSDYERALFDHYQRWFSYILARQKEKEMLLASEIIGNPVISVSDGQTVGKVRDLYLNAACDKVAGLYLGTEGLFSRTAHFVNQDDVVVIGPDAALVRDDSVVREAGDGTIGADWLRRDDLQGRPVDTEGGTKVGRIGDLIINKSGEVHGFSLSNVYVDGPVADNRAIARHTVRDLGTEDGVLTVDLAEAEQQQLTAEPA